MSKVEAFWRAIGGRKFIGFILATYLCITGKISDQVWLAAFITYCSANVFQKIKMKGGENK